jgi:hypothetical protein
MRFTETLFHAGQYFTWLNNMEEIAHAKVAVTFQSMAAWMVETDEGREFMEKLRAEADPANDFALAMPPADPGAGEGKE